MKDAGRGGGAFKVYPVCEGEERCFDYRCFINGRETPPDTARVSAVPFNRRWPGHQREKEQTELVNFLCFATSGGAEIAIYPQKPFGSVKIRPRDLDADVEVVPGEKIVIRLNAPGYFTVEPYGTEHVLHVFADPMPRYETEKGGDVLFREISAEYDEYNRPERIQLKDGEKYAFLYDGEYAPPFVSFYIEKHFEYSMIKSEEELGDICGVRLENIRCFARQKPVFAFSGHSEKSGVRKVFFDGAFWNGERISPEFFERRSIKNPFCSEIRLI